MKICFNVKMLLLPVFLTMVVTSFADDCSASGSSYVTTQGTTGNGDTVFIKAQFPGGAAAWRKHLMMNLRYPPEAFRQGIEGTVFLHFTVNEKGKLRDIGARGAAARVLEAEAIRILRAGGKWIPATINGKSVSSTVEQAIIFKME